MKSLSIDLKSDGIGILIFHPVWVKTDMGGPHALIELISCFNIKNTGQFIKYDGSQLPW